MEVVRARSFRGLTDIWVCDLQSCGYSQLAKELNDVAQQELEEKQNLLDSFALLLI